MRTVLPAVLLATLVLPVGAHATWGEKSRLCPRWTDQLAALEQAGGAETRRGQRLRNKLADYCVAMNEVQVLGTHNSYHLKVPQELMDLYLSTAPVFEAWEYEHPALDVQLETQGARQFELDVYADPMGGLFSHRGALYLIGQDTASGLPALDQPGIKVIHIPDLDFESNCLTFVECLRTIKSWSDAHADHLPLTVLVELKVDGSPDLGGGAAVPIPWGPAEMDALDAEIRSVFPKRKLITPDRVRRRRATLEEAVLTLGWPRLRSVRGKVIFLMDNGGQYRTDYLLDHPSLEGRVLFTNSSPGQPDAAFVKLNNPFDANIPTRVAAGYLVRTRADADTEEARSGDTGPRDAALASGAQFVSTDYPVPDPAFTDYFVQIPGGMPARCNPVNAPTGCRTVALERLQ
jgi:hypothetical protein